MAWNGWPSKKAYVFPGVPNEALATILAGIIGTLIVFGIALAVAYTRRSRQASN